MFIILNYLLNKNYCESATIRKTSFKFFTKEIKLM